MLSINDKEYVFEQKYRPTSIDDIVLPEKLKTKFRKYVKDGQIPNLLLAGRTPGTGKTSLVHTLITELNAEALFINSSLNADMDMLRNRLQQFASTASFDGRPKIVVLDEADFIAPKGQAALRGLIEEFSKNARFILTCNYPDKIIEPVRNRLSLINFDDIIVKYKDEMITATAKRTIEVLKNENITFEKSDLVWLIRHYFPSNREILNKIQSLSTSGTLEINKDDLDLDKMTTHIVDNIENKDFEKMRKAIQKLPDPGTLFMVLFDNIERFSESVRPAIIISIAKYQAYDGQVRDRVINATACGCEIIEML